MRKEKGKGKEQGTEESDIYGIQEGRKQTMRARENEKEGVGVKGRQGRK